MLVNAITFFITAPTLSHRKPASVTTRCDSCGAKVKGKRNALHVWLDATDLST